jgi:hypothetical protein
MSRMTLDQLIDRLSDIREEIGGDAPVRGVQQPSYPLLGQIEAITTVQTGDESEVFIGLAEPKAYGSHYHYEDDFVDAEDQEDEE